MSDLVNQDSLTDGRDVTDTEAAEAVSCTGTPNPEQNKDELLCDPGNEPVPEQDAGSKARDTSRRTYDGRETFGFMIRGVAGAYVIYLAYQIMRDMIRIGDIRWYMVAACAVFAVFGVFFIYLSLRYLGDMRRHNLEEAAEREREANDPEYAAMKAKERAERGESEPASPARGGLFGGAAAAAQQPPRSFTGSDIRERLRQINEADGLEIDEITDEADDED